MLKAAASMMIFYFFFLILLKKETNFSQNRLYLMATFFLSLTLPLINISIFNSVPVNTSVVYSLLLEPVRVSGDKIGNGLQFTGKFHFTVILYMLVSLFFFGRLLVSIIYTLLVKYTGQRSSKYGIKFIVTHRAVKPFTFLRTIVIGKEDAARPELYQILLHEQVHAKKLHTIDLILTEIFKAVCWFNPFVYLYQNLLREVHEYQADAAIIDKGHDSFSYQQLLLNQLFNTKNIQFSNFFNYSLIQKRINMITNDKSSRYSVHKLLMILPLAIMIVSGFSCAKEEPGTSNETGLNNNDTVVLVSKDLPEKSGSVAGEKKSSDEEVFFVVEDMPDFNGKGPEGFRQYIATHLHYPEEAVKKRIQGRVFVQFNVNSQGKVTNSKVVRGVDPLLDAEALRVVNNSPDWKPGMQWGQKVSVQFTFPINFALK